MEIVYSFTIEDIAKLIRQIGDKARAQSTVWNKMEWPKRKWLTNEASAVRLKEGILDHVQEALALNQVKTSSYSGGKTLSTKR